MEMNIALGIGGQHYDGNEEENESDNSEHKRSNL